MIYVHFEGGKILPRPRFSRLGGSESKDDLSFDFDLVENADPPRPEERHRIVSALAGTLLRSRCSFPYFMLVALEAGGPLRALLLLLSFPIAWLLCQVCGSEEPAIRIFTFISLAGLRAAAVQGVAKAVLPKAFLEDVHAGAYKVFTSCARRILVSSLPGLLLEAFAKDHLEAELLLASRVQVTSSGFCTGFLDRLLLHKDQACALREELGSAAPDIGIGDLELDRHLLHLCKKAYVVVGAESSATLKRTDYTKPLIFHDGRLARRPTPLWALTLMLWLPIGLLLAVLRIGVGVVLPKRLALPLEHLLGVSIRVRGTPPPKHPGALLVLPHRTLVDPIFVAFAMGRELAAVTYSLSRVSEMLSPIKTVRLARNKRADAMRMETLLQRGHLAVCPEGTTCREPYLLRFSALFAELTDRIVPVSLDCNPGLFHGTSARGWKCMDALFFFMNPRPSYEVTFLQQLPPSLTVAAGGQDSHYVANHVQRLLAESLGFDCTTLTRRDKYQVLAGTDGTVATA